MTVDRGPAADDHGGALAPVWDLDRAIPADLAGRWRASDTDALVCQDFARSLLSVGGVLLMLGCLITAVTGEARGASVAGFTALGAVMLQLVHRSHRRARTRPGVIAAAEIDLVLAHRRRVTFEDWNALPRDGAPQEVAAARRAADLADQLTGLPEWTTDIFAPHRARFDPNTEAQLIQLGCRELYDLRVSVGAAVATTGEPTTPTVLAAQREWGELLDATWVSLSDRLDCFQAFTADTVALARRIRAAEAAQQLSVSLVQQEAELAVAIAGHELAAAHVRRLGNELAALQMGVAEMRIG